MTEASRQSAKAILDNIRNTYLKQTLVKVNAKEFGHLDLAKYREFRVELSNADFSYLGDIEIPEVTAVPNTVLARTMIRNMTSQDGSILAQYYQVKPRQMQVWKNFFRGIWNFRLIAAPLMLFNVLKTRHCIGFETEFEDGRFLLTSNAQAASQMEGPKAIESIFFRYGTPKELLYAVHLSRMAEIAKESPPKHCRTLVDVVAMQRRQAELKARHRLSVNLITRDEILRMSGGNCALADDVYHELEKLLQEEKLLGALST